MLSRCSHLMELFSIWWCTMCKWCEISRKVDSGISHSDHWPQPASQCALESHHGRYFKCINWRWRCDGIRKAGRCNVRHIERIDDIHFCFRIHHFFFFTSATGHLFLTDFVPSSYNFFPISFNFQLESVPARQWALSLIEHNLDDFEVRHPSIGTSVLKFPGNFSEIQLENRSPEGSWWEWSDAGYFSQFVKLSENRIRFEKILRKDARRTPNQHQLEFKLKFYLDAPDGDFPKNHTKRVHVRFSTVCCSEINFRSTIRIRSSVQVEFKLKN